MFKKRRIRKEKIKVITDILNEFLKEFDCTAKFGADFEYNLVKNRITYALVVPDSMDKKFVKNAEKWFPYVHADVFLWSFLHELGHHETEDDFEEQDWKVYFNIVGTPHLDPEIYYNLPIEAAATRWAGEFMESHTKEVATLWNKLVPAIHDFYEVTGLV